MKIILKQIRKVCMMLCFAVMSVTAFAQAQVKGVVTNVKDGMPAQGVTVSVKGTSTTTQTDNKGTFSILAPPNGTLIFSSVSFDRQEVGISGKTYLAVSITSSTTSLDEVIVVGYGTQKRREITGAITKVSG